MWRTALLAGVVGVGAFVATVVIGRPLVDPDDGTEAAAVTTHARTWIEQANERCRAAVGEVRDELATAGTQQNTPERSVRLFRSTTEIEGQLLRGLRSIPPAPGRAAAIDRVLDLFEDQYDRDAATSSKLKKRYDFFLLTREVAAYERVATQLRTLFRDLGAGGCAAYFDPRTYG
ncbi:MAG TPA: hypothetical protein VIA10_00790 [Gaiellaceae bacterium]|jgi:hypothetical protein